MCVPRRPSTRICSIAKERTECVARETRDFAKVRGRAPAKEAHSRTKRKNREMFRRCHETQVTNSQFRKFFIKIELNDRTAPLFILSLSSSLSIQFRARSATGVRNRSASCKKADTSNCNELRVYVSKPFPDSGDWTPEREVPRI